MSSDDDPLQRAHEDIVAAKATDSLRLWTEGGIVADFEDTHIAYISDDDGDYIDLELTWRGHDRVLSDVVAFFDNNPLKSIHIGGDEHVWTLTLVDGDATFNGAVEEPITATVDMDVYGVENSRSEFHTETDSYNES